MGMPGRIGRIQGEIRAGGGKAAAEGDLHGGHLGRGHAPLSTRKYVPRNTRSTRSACRGIRGARGVPAAEYAEYAAAEYAEYAEVPGQGLVSDVRESPEGRSR